MASDYIADHITQIDSGKCRFTNCWAAVGAYLVDSGTRGKKRPTPMEFRKAAGAMRGCRTGGLGDIIVGCQRYGVRVTLKTDVNRATLSRWFASRKSERVYAGAADWEVWPDDKKCAGDYDGYHATAIVPGLNQQKNVRTMDPLCSKLRWVRKGDIIDALFEYNDEHPGQKRNTADVLYVRVPKA